VESFLASAAQSQPPRTAGRTLLDREVYDEVLKLLTLHGTIADHENQLERIEEEREKIYMEQQQVQGNMQALSQTGREGELRARYVGQIEVTEAQLRRLEEREAELKTAIQQVEDEIAARLEALG
jgi:chromosome segregation ATPase